MIPAITVILPLLVAGFAVLFIKERPSAVRYIAFGASVLSLIIAALLFFSPAQSATYQWFSVAGYLFDISTTTQSINMLFLLLISIMTPLIFLYSFGFMSVPSEQKRFYFEMCTFAAAMMLFAISSSFITMFIAWELLGITSYLLIGFWYKKDRPPEAARISITTMLIGDVSMLIGIILIGLTYHGFLFATALASPTPALAIALLLILGGALTKSAQFPFNEWLSHAMEGPTPVSTYLHSSTMVKAGVFLIALLLPLYAGSGILPVILGIGIITALIGATNAVMERHIKKILAYSTMEDLGLMFVALGLGSPSAAILLFFVQTFYKAVLFMDAGIIMKANDEEEDIFKIYNTSSSRALYITLMIGAFSLAGVFPLSGFFGKAAIGTASSSNMPIYLLLLIIEFITSQYIFRWVFLPARAPYGKDNGRSSAKAHYHATPRSMKAPTYILAALIIAAPLAVLPVLAYIGSTAGLGISLAEAILLNAVALLGFGAAYFVYAKRHRIYIASKSKLVYGILYSSQAINWLYLAVASAFSMVAGVVTAFDSALDKATYRAASAVSSSGLAIRPIVNGQVNVYAFLFIVGLVAFGVAVSTGIL